MFYHDFNEGKVTGQKTKILMQIRAGSPEKEKIRYFYGNRDKPFQITAIFSTRYGWTKLYHDDKDRLFAMLTLDEDVPSNQILYYIITDNAGTPTHILNCTGKLNFIILNK